MPHTLTRVCVRLHTTKRTKPTIYNNYSTFLNKKKTGTFAGFFFEYFNLIYMNCQIIRQMYIFVTNI